MGMWTYAFEQCAYNPISVVIPSDDGVFPMVYNPLHIQPRAQRRTTRKQIHHLNLTNTAVAPAGVRLSLLGQPGELAIRLLRLHRECYLCIHFFLMIR
jgi:hypothetical protein